MKMPVTEVAIRRRLVVCAKALIEFPAPDAPFVQFEPPSVVT